MTVTDGPTPHLEGTRGDYAPTVLLPGDPKRARFIADTYLDDVRQVNAVRGADGFTGTFEGTPVSVQSVGMGVPSAAIYYTELIRFYGCERLIRVGSCGGLSEEITLGDVILATAAGTDSAAVATLNGGLALPPVADWGMLRGAVEAAEAASVERQVDAILARRAQQLTQQGAPQPTGGQFATAPVPPAARTQDPRMWSAPIVPPWAERPEDLGGQA